MEFNQFSHGGKKKDYHEEEEKVDLLSAAAAAAALTSSLLAGLNIFFITGLLLFFLPPYSPLAYLPGCQQASYNCGFLLPMYGELVQFPTRFIDHGRNVIFFKVN